MKPQHFALVGAFFCLISSHMPAFSQSRMSARQNWAMTSQSAKLDAWRGAILASAQRTNGCFSIVYPETSWKSVPCRTPPKLPYIPSRHRSHATGDGEDVTAWVPDTLEQVTGSFVSVTGVTSESGNVKGLPPAVSNTFSLELSSNPFVTPLCNGKSLCRAWQQFVFSNSGSAFIQYWLLDYGTICPSGWNPYGSDCWRNGETAAAIPVQTITNLASLSISGVAGVYIEGTYSDMVEVVVGNQAFYTTQGSNIFDLKPNWQGVEFNVVGDCCGSIANFNSGSKLVLKISTPHSSSLVAPPTCDDEAFAEEQNNLFFAAGTLTPAPTTTPAILFTESSIPSTAPPCVSAVTVSGTLPPPPPVQYTYCIGQYKYIVGGGCGNNPQQWWDCSHQGQDYIVGKQLCASKNYAYYKTMRTQDPVGGDQCGYSYGLMFCSDTQTPDMLCKPSDHRFGCQQGPSSP